MGGHAHARFGYDLPLAVKRGYHMHYRAAGHARLNHPVLDTERGYFLAPMRRGIRLTTGAEFALRDAIKSPVQLGRAEPIARDLFPLAERLDNEPWMGARPCTPDMLPILGPAPRHKNPGSRSARASRPHARARTGASWPISSGVLLRPLALPRTSASSGSS